MYSKFSFGEVYRRIYGRKFSFIATRKRSLKRDFRTYIRRYTSPNENFEYGYPHSNALLTFSFQKDSENVLCCAYTSSGCQLHKTACQLHIFTCQPIKSDVTLWRRVCDSISQDVLSQIYDVSQSNVACHLQVHLNFY